MVGSLLAAGPVLHVIRRLLASAVLFALLAGVCPPAGLAAAAGHDCCPAERAGCPSVGVLTCCAPVPVAPASQAPSSASTVGINAAPAGSIILLALPTAPARGALAAAAPCATHGVDPLPPLLHTCLWRI